MIHYLRQLLAGDPVQALVCYDPKTGAERYETQGVYWRDATHTEIVS